MNEDIEIDEKLSIEEGEAAGELPPSTEILADEATVESNELANFEAVEIEEIEFIENDKLLSIIESVLFASDRPVTVETIKSVFKGTNIKTKDIRRALEDLSTHYAELVSGVMLEEIGGGYQLRTKIDNVEYMKRHVKGRSFKLSGPALEVLSIVAYKQPSIKAHVDEIRGVESGHLMRALMDRGLIRFAGKSELPGKPMFYETTRKFLEIFGLRNINELPSLGEIDELIPEGIGDIVEEKQTIGDLTGELSMATASTYSDGESELIKITDQLTSIQTSSDFFEKEKIRQKRKRDEERAQDIRETMMLGSEVSSADTKWLKKYEAALEEEKKLAEVITVESSLEAAIPAGSDIEIEEVSVEIAEFSDDIIETVNFEMNDEFFDLGKDNKE